MLVKVHEEKISNMTSYAAQVKCKSLLELELTELASSGLQSELSSQQGLEANFII